MQKAIFLLLLVILTSCSSMSVKVARILGYLSPVEGYLVKNIGIISYGGQVFCSYEVLDTKQENINIDVYVWVLCEEYYLDDNALKMGTGSSLPVALHLQKVDSEYRLLSYEVPKDGTEYGPSIKNIFPPIAIKRMCEGDADCYNERAGRLELEVLQKAKEYYGAQ
jgi:hypothetical protein